MARAQRPELTSAPLTTIFRAKPNHVGKAPVQIPNRQRGIGGGRSSWYIILRACNTATWRLPSRQHARRAPVEFYPGPSRILPRMFSSASGRRVAQRRAAEQRETFLTFKARCDENTLLEKRRLEGTVGLCMPNPACIIQNFPEQQLSCPKSTTKSKPIFFNLYLLYVDACVRVNRNG